MLGYVIGGPLAVRLQAVVGQVPRRLGAVVEIHPTVHRPSGRLAAPVQSPLLSAPPASRRSPRRVASPSTRRLRVVSVVVLNTIT